MPVNEVSSGIAGKIVRKMFQKEPKVDRDGHLVFTKSKWLLVAGVLLILIYLPFVIFPKALTLYAVESLKFSSDIQDKAFWGWYLGSIFLMLVGMVLIIRSFVEKIWIAPTYIEKRTLFSTRRIYLSELRAIKYTSRRGFVFKDDTHALFFGRFTNGLIPMYHYVEKAFHKDVTEKALERAEKAINESGLSV